MEEEPKRFKDFNHSFDFYDMWKYKTNEYQFRAGKGKLPTQLINTFVIEKLYERLIDFGDGDGRGVTVVTKEAIERFHPNMIDNKAFWLRAHSSFPLLSVCGGECKNIKELNAKTLELSNTFHLFPFLKNLVDKSKTPLSVLEIGFGFGNVFNELKDKCEYIGIDYRIPKALKKYKNFIEIQESGIPEFLRDDKFFDVIYSVNVLQHCSQKDRFDYFQQGHSSLKTGGYFIFSCMLMNKANENDKYWGIKDSTGRGYLHFFNQLTECDWDYELFNHLQGLGFKPVNGWLMGNHFSMIVQKL
jgi:SAM-dependent methyltransferase